METGTENQNPILEQLRNIAHLITEKPFGDYSATKLAQKSEIAKYHFHRLFSSFFGISIYEYIVLTRMKAAAEHLIKSPNLSITNIAHDCNYSDEISFTKSFVLVLGQTPSDFRKNPDWHKYELIADRLELTETHFSKNNLPHNIEAEKLEVVEFPQTIIAAIIYKGKINETFETVRKYNEWCKGQNIDLEKLSLFNIFPKTKANIYEIEIGCKISPDKEVSEDIHKLLIPSHKCVSFKFKGDPQNIEKPASGLYRWIIDNGYEPVNYPLFCERTKFEPFAVSDECETILYVMVK